MSWWKPRYTVCTQCGVHFEPVTHDARGWWRYCSTHREAIAARDRRVDRILAWARGHLDQVESLLVQSEKEELEKQNQLLAKMYTDYSAQFLPCQRQ